MFACPACLLACLLAKPAWLSPACLFACLPANQPATPSSLLRYVYARACTCVRSSRCDVAKFVSSIVPHRKCHWRVTALYDDQNSFAATTMTTAPPATSATSTYARDFPPPAASRNRSTPRTLPPSLSLFLPRRSVDALSSLSRARARARVYCSSPLQRPHRATSRVRVFAPTTSGNVASSCDVLSHTVPESTHSGARGSLSWYAADTRDHGNPRATSAVIRTHTCMRREHKRARLKPPRRRRQRRSSSSSSIHTLATLLADS